MRTLEDVVRLLEVRLEQLEIALSLHDDRSIRARREILRLKLARYKQHMQRRYQHVGTGDVQSVP